MKPIRQQFKRVLVSAAYTAGVLLTGSTYAAEPGVTQNEVVIAQVGPLTGVLSGPNRENVEGALAYLKFINKQGGIHGRKISLKQFDDEQNPQRALDITRKLIADRSVFAFAMHRTSPTLEKVVPEATKAGYPVFAPQVGPTFAFEPFNPLVFNVRARYRDEVAKIIEYLNTTGSDGFGFLYADDAFGHDNMVGAQQAMEKLKLKPVAQVLLDNRTTDIGPAVEVFAKTRPQVIVIITNAKAAAEFVKQMRKSGVDSQFVSLSNTSGDGFIKDLGEAGNGVIVTQVMPYPYSDSVPIAREFRKLMRENSSAVPSYASIQGFISAKLLVEGLKRAGPNLTQRGFAKALESIGNLDLGGYLISYGPSNHDGSRYVDITMIKNGRFLR
jgi:ABC-type branched-subunit amino acid transport system substrate-binding protein